MRRTAAEVERTLTPLIEDMGYELVDVEFGKKSNGMNLTVCIHREGGVSLDDCERVHRAIDPVLDELDPTEGSAYTLNVSSPGLDRPLKTMRDFDKCMGQKTEVKLFAPLKGKKYFEAVLRGFDGNCVTLEEEDGTLLKLELNRIAKINRAVDFDSLD